MKVIRAIALSTCSLFFAGCVSVQATRLGGDAIYAPTTPDRVFIYRTANQVPGDYVEIALLSAKGDYSMTSEEDMFKSMREKAAEMGANGIILDSMSEPTTRAKVAQAFIGTSANREGKALAIRLTDKSK